MAAIRGFCRAGQNLWGIYSFQGCPSYVFAQKLKALKSLTEDEKLDLIAEEAEEGDGGGSL